VLPEEGRASVSAFRGAAAQASAAAAAAVRKLDLFDFAGRYERSNLKKFMEGKHLSTVKSMEL